MEWAFDASAVVLALLVVAAALVMLEVALPTFGLAGITAGGLAVLAGWLLYRGGDAWWPLVGVVLGVAVWSVLLAARRNDPSVRVIAGGLFGIGGFGYGVLVAEPTTAALAILSTLLLSLAFEPLSRANMRLAALPAHVGMESLVGREAEVVAWRGHTGTVRVEGSLWNARGSAARGWMAGDVVQVEGFEGMTVIVGEATSVR